LEKILTDYMRWVFRLEFCTPGYLITRVLDLEKLKIRWGIKHEDLKIKKIEDNR